VHSPKRLAPLFTPPTTITGHDHDLEITRAAARIVTPRFRKKKCVQLRNCDVKYKLEFDNDIKHNANIVLVSLHDIVNMRAGPQGHKAGSTFAGSTQFAQFTGSGMDPPPEVSLSQASRPSRTILPVIGSSP